MRLAAPDRGIQLAALAAFPNLVTMFLARAANLKGKPFLHARRDGAWRTISWEEAARQVAALAAALTRLGLKRGDRVMLVSENRPEWCIADLAIMAAGCVTVPAYTTNTTRDHAHVLTDSGACATIVSNRKLAEALLPAVLDSRCAHVIAIEALAVTQSGSFECHGWADLTVSAGDIATLRASACAIDGDALACIIYTSGTGGLPRGVMLSHRNILHNVYGCAAIIAEDFGWEDELFLSFLPLSHAYEHSAGQHLPIGLGAGIAYAESLEKLAANIAELRPTIMVVVPRLFELLRQRITRAIGKEGRIARWLLAAAERQAGRGRRSGDGLLDRLLERTLRAKVRARFGGRLKALVSGGAPLEPEVGRFFQATGMTLLQGYGQTEAAPVISCNRPAAGIAMESVGPPLAGVELRIADDGEVLVRGANVMLGYWRDDAGTARTIDADGWLATGDIGCIDSAGRLVITDRKKDILVNDKGDTIAPQRIEGLLTLEREIGQAMVWGDRRPYLVALIVPDAEWTAELDGDGPAVRRRLQAAIDRVNARLSVIEKVRRILVADEPFAITNGQLTPSLKLRRHVLRDVYGPQLDALYRA